MRAQRRGKRGSVGLEWRRWNRVLHRDLGYLCFGLTVVYALSGVALNHVADWNPNYLVERDQVHVGDLSSVKPEALAGEVMARLQLDEPVRNTFRPDPETLQVFLAEGTLTVRPSAGIVELETVTERPVLRPMNVLHLNVPKRGWTWVADVYALLLAVVAATGVLVGVGRGGFRGRAGWLTALGVSVPLVFLALHYG